MLMEKPKSHVKFDCDAYPGAEAVRQELERVLESSAFKGTPRRKKLLRYLVDELLGGRGGELKGYSIATLVFDRDDSFDPQADPVVRLEARRLRHDLDGYYASAGRENPLRITIPKGQYAPVIEWAESEVAVQQSPPVSGMVADATPSVSPLIGYGDIGVARPYRRTAFIAVASLLFLFGILAYSFFTPKAAIADHRSMENGTSIVVLPFDTDSSNPRNVLLATGMADEIMGGINRFGGVRLYLASGLATKVSGNDPIQIGRDLDLTYVLSGTMEVDEPGGMLRVTTRLVDVKTQRILWIGSYDREYSANSFRAVQLEIANSIASALGQPYGVLRTADINNLSNSATTTMSSYECVLQAYAYRRLLTQALHAPALSCLERAIKRDPNYVDAWGMLAWLYMDEGRFGWLKIGTKEDAYRRAISTAQHALALDRNNVAALKALSSTLHYMGDFAESLRVQRLAYAANPNDPDTLAQLGWRLAVRGNFKEGIPILNEAIERSVNPPGWYYHLIAIDQYLNGRYADMRETARRSTSDGSGMSWSFVAIAEGALGQTVAAHEALARMAEKSPLLARDPASAYRRHQAIDSIVDALVAGLRKAGWNDRIASADPM